MTEFEHSHIDLSPIADLGGERDAARVVRHVIRHVAASGAFKPSGALSTIGARAPRVVAASLLLVLTMSAIERIIGDSSAPSIATVASAWLTNQHVPSNEELLAAFEGYR